MPTSVDAAPPPRASPRGPTARQYKPDPAPARDHLDDALPAWLRTPPEDPKAAQAGPCAGCRHFDRCTAEVIACEAFVLFARFGNDFSAGRWKLAPRQPSAAILQRLVGPQRRSKLDRQRARAAAV